MRQNSLLVCGRYVKPTRSTLCVCICMWRTFQEVGHAHTKRSPNTRYLMCAGQTSNHVRHTHYSLYFGYIRNTWQKYITDQDALHFSICHMVSPPQMPVPLKRMYNANIPRAEITTFVPSCPPMLHTIIKPKLSFFKNCFENGMLTSCVLSYAPMLVKRSVLPRSPEIFLRPFPEKTNPSHRMCPSENLT